jgi:hypothetical protein
MEFSENPKKSRNYLKPTKMKKLILMIGIGIAISSSSFGQQLIILTTNDTIRGTVENIVGDDLNLRIIRPGGKASKVPTAMIKSNFSDVDFYRKNPLLLENKNKSTNGWLWVSGAALMASGIIDLFKQNQNFQLTNSQSAEHDLNDYINKQKNLSGISSGCKVISGLSLMVGVTIYFK